MDTHNYELMYIIRPTVGDEEIGAALTRVDTIIGNLGGEVGEKNQMGKRRLAYPIDKHEDGYYVVQTITIDPQQISGLEEQLRISDEVIRHIVVVPFEAKAPRVRARRERPQQTQP
ncbi:MAG: 30S ribosomal protein S6 [Chloroflexota bacterium]|nr:30S ribosomal protein S6 [Chloroflexota bacterium]